MEMPRPRATRIPYRNEPVADYEWQRLIDLMAETAGHVVGSADANYHMGNLLAEMWNAYGGPCKRCLGYGGVGHDAEGMPNPVPCPDCGGSGLASSSLLVRLVVKHRRKEVIKELER